MRDFQRPILGMLNAMREAIGAPPVPLFPHPCESPIEYDLLRAFQRSKFFVMGGGTFDPEQVYAVPELYGFPEKIVVWQQHEFLGRFRADFLVAAWRTNRTGIQLALVECDGREFHMGSVAEQRDLFRDCDAWRAGYGVLRFTGSQLYHDADACAGQVAAAFHGSTVPFPAPVRFVRSVDFAE